jgi:hypothetical protein
MFLRDYLSIHLFSKNKNYLPNFSFSILLILIWLFMQISVESQVLDSARYTINLKSRSFLPETGIGENIITKLQASIIKDKKSPYVMIQFKSTPSRHEIDMLNLRRIKLLSYIGGNAWYARLGDTTALRFTSPNITVKYPSLNNIRWIGEIVPLDKVHPYLKTKGPGSWAINSDGTIKISVDFYEDVTRQEAKSILSKYNALIESERTRRISYYISINPEFQDSLTNEEKVKSISIYPPPKMEFNDGSRNWTNTNIVHTQNAKSDSTIMIEGNGVIVGIWDGNEVDDVHLDLTGRVTFSENPRTNVTSEHSTHVAGTMSGNGSFNFNRRGHAPMAEEIVSYDFNDDVIIEVEEAIDNHNIVISNNSWGFGLGWAWNNNIGAWVWNDNQSFFGDYIDECFDFDKIVWQERLNIVFAAGNDRDDDNPANNDPNRPPDWDQGTGNNGFLTMSPHGSAKNIITVGAINDANNNMSNFSNWGPTEDGRIKPDVVAPGENIWSCDDNPDNGYVQMSGTSMAAPAISGILALLIQTYRDEFFNDINSDEVPLPSSLKALLIHSAQDLGNPGPDYEFGWGGVDADSAYRLLRSRLILESQLLNAEEDMFNCNVPAGINQFHVTICWDDFPGGQLINDLDLTVEAPDGTIFNPWVLDPAPGSWANNATTGTDRTNNVEQVWVNNPASGIWKIKIKGHSVNEPADNPFQRYSLVSDFPFQVLDNISVVQVVDRTGSMSYRDKQTYPTYMESAKIAAQNFIGLMQLGDEVGVVAFDDIDCDYRDGTAEARFNLVEMTTEVIRNNAVTSIDGLISRGCTSIGAGMQLSQTGPNFLDIASSDNPHAMILLTDGFENTTPWVRERPPDITYAPTTPNNVLLSIPDKTDIYTIALGTSADEDLLKDIASTTGGKYYQSPTILGLLSIYYQIHGDLELGDMTDLAVGTKSSGNDTRKVVIDPQASQATFAIGWLQENGRLTLSVKDPNGNQVISGIQGVTSGTGSTYSYITVINPIGGEWEVHITRDDRGTFNIDYTFTAFVKGANKTWSFVPTFEEAGECLFTKVHLFDDRTLKPITGATVKAVITYPQESRLTMHYNLVKAAELNWDPQIILYPKKLTRTAAGTTTQINDELPLWTTRLQEYNMANIEKTGYSIFKYDTLFVQLFDDGSNGDLVANDGIYTICINKTKIAGSYNINFIISGVSNSGYNFERKIISSSLIKPGIVDPSKVLVRVDPQIIDVKEGSEGVITIVPIDRFGNVFGPGHFSKISLSTTAGILQGDVIDNGDGFYFQKIVSNGTQESGKIDVKIDGTEVSTHPLVTFGIPFNHFGLSIHSGVAIPTGEFADNFDPGVNFLLDAGYYFYKNWALIGFFGYNKFTAKNSGTDDSEIWNVSLNLRYYKSFSTMPGTNWSYYIGAGPGIYIQKAGDTKFGYNFGAGINYVISPTITGEFGVDYHKTFNEIQFIHNHVGVIYRF